MKRWHLNHEYPNYFVNQLLDPDFDDLGGELTLAQIRDPVLTWAEIWQPPVSPMGGDPLVYAARQRAHIEHQHQQLEHWAQRFEHAFKSRVSYKQKRLNRIYRQLQPAFEQQIPHRRAQLKLVSRRFLKAQLKDYPKFQFAPWSYDLGHHEKWGYTQGYRQKCNRCVPYNGHFTVNYWATGQKDPW